MTNVINTRVINELIGKIANPNTKYYNKFKHIIINSESKPVQVINLLKEELNKIINSQFTLENIKQKLKNLHTINERVFNLFWKLGQKKDKISASEFLNFYANYFYDIFDKISNKIPNLIDISNIKNLENLLESIEYLIGMFSGLASSNTSPQIFNGAGVDIDPNKYSNIKKKMLEIKLNILLYIIGILRKNNKSNISKEINEIKTKLSDTIIELANIVYNFAKKQKNSGQDFNNLAEELLQLVNLFISNIITNRSEKINKIKTKLSITIIELANIVYYFAKKQKNSGQDFNNLAEKLLELVNLFRSNNITNQQINLNTNKKVKNLKNKYNNLVPIRFATT